MRRNGGWVCLVQLNLKVLLFNVAAWYKEPRAKRAQGSVWDGAHRVPDQLRIL